MDARKMFKGILIFWVFWVLFCLTVMGALCYVALHFLMKFW